MELQLKVKTIRDMAKLLGDDAERLGTASWRQKGMKPSDTLLINVRDLEPAELQQLKEVMKANDEPTNRQFSRFVNVMNDPTSKSVPSLDKFIPLFKLWLKEKDNPWLYSTNPKMAGIAYCVVEAVYYPSEYRRREDPYVSIEFGYNTKMEYRTWSISLYKSDMNEQMDKILEKKGLTLPDEDLVERYKRLYNRYQEFGGMHGEQFWVRGEAAVRSRNSRRDYYWWSESKINLMGKGRPTKAVLDLGLDNDRADSTRFFQHSDVYGTRVKVPTHPVLPCFSLAHHQTVWVNVADMSPYKYEEGLGDRLVLPNSHRKLIGSLVKNLEVLKMEAEVEGKSRTIRAKASSNIILAMGKAGTGKTLTAEVYAEEIQRPLYEVNSGQLGSTPSDIETNLNDILDRSVRLKMPLLINEADVFIMTRGTSMTQNSVCTIFLRLLEYHTGLVFMTTNRPQDVDEAIKSRCIAEITYLVPKAPERKSLWQGLLAEFNVELSKEELKRAIEIFPTVTGRDIQNLIRLTSRYCTAVEEQFNLQALIDCSIFKSIDLLEGTKVSE
jgi:ATPase family associated with various cellular activities (AAA)